MHAPLGMAVGEHLAVDVVELHEAWIAKLLLRKQWDTGSRAPTADALDGCGTAFQHLESVCCGHRHLDPTEIRTLAQ